MTINDNDWVRVTDGADLFYHDWTKAPTLVGCIEQVVMKDDVDSPRYYVINCGDFSLRVYPYATLRCLQKLDVDTCVKIDYQGTRKSQKGNHLYTVFDVYKTNNPAKLILGLYDSEGVLIEDITNVLYNDEDLNKA